MATIPGLPTDWIARDGTPLDLSVVPPGPTAAEDPRRDAKVAAWGRWASEVNRYRRVRRIECRDPEQQAVERAKVERYGPKYFVAVWCHFHEPRQRRFRQVWDLVAPPGEEPEHPGWLPAIPFSYQVELIDWSMTPRKRRLCSKPRDMGVSWLLCLAMCWRFLYERPYSAKLISRREDEVYIPGKLNCLFGRVACHLVTNRWPAATLPEFLRPRGWDNAEHLRQLMLTHPEHENVVTGESTSSRSGRGDRSQDAFVDEAAHIRELRELLAALAQTADEITLVSSEYVGTTDFWGELADNLKAVDPGAVLELDYWQHPFHDEAYLREEREAMQDDEAFEREIMRNRWAGNPGWLYEQARDIQPLETVKELEEGAIFAVGFDPGQDDETALAAIELNSVAGRDTVLEAYAARGRTPEFWAALILGCDPDDPALAEYNLRFTERERWLAEWFRAHPQPTVYGDPYGENAIKKKGESYYNDMRLFALRHNPRTDADGTPRPLSIVCGWAHEQRHLQHRRLATMKWLPRLDWNPTPDVLKTLHALKNSRFDKPEDPRQAEQKDAKHDQLSHRRTSIEFVAVNLGIAYRVEQPRAAPYAGAGSRDAGGSRDDTERRAA